MDELRLRITDEEAVEEHRIFKKEIGLMMLRTRYFYWVVLMILLCFALTLSYVSTFEGVLESQAVEKTASLSRQKAVFLLFWAGCFCDDKNDGDQDYSYVTYPYYLLLLIVIFERLAQIWVQDRFGCSEEQIKIFKDIEEKVEKYKQRAKKRRLEAKHDSQKL